MNRQSPPRASGTSISCPKCGVEQESEVECLRCGIIFAKYKPPLATEENASPPSRATAHPDERSLISRTVRLLPWMSLAATVTVLFLILKQGPPLPIKTDPEAADRVADKMAQLQLAIQSSQRHVATLNEAELNQWARENLAIASSHEAQRAGIPVPTGHEPTVKEVRSALKDIRMTLSGNQLHAYVLFLMYGKEVSLQLDGLLETRDGYIQLKPTSGKIGSLPIPSFTLDRVVRQLFNSPENRDKFQLPPEVESVSIQDSSLVIATR
jgi:hypothetical protein